MMLVPVIIAESPVHGVGLFTVAPIKAGTPLYRFGEGDKRILLSVATNDQKHYGYVCPRTPEWLSICGDRARFWNFPNDGTPPNAVERDIEASGEAIIVAAGDILAGEELLIDRASDLDAARKLSS